jgi:hypothetical protein
MIINTGGRTDTVQYFAPWLLRRFEEGYVLSRNPQFPDKVNRYELTPDKVDCVLFCSKNYEPILKDIHRITDRFGSYFFYTITAYGKDVEPGVPSIEESISTLKELSSIVGRQRLTWRYDPVLLTERYTVERHIETFSRMAREIAPYVRNCVFSFVDMYDKLLFNMPEIIPLTQEDMDVLAEALGRIAGECGLSIQICGTDTDYSRFGIGRSGCMTLEVLGEANGMGFRDLKHRGMRNGCHCIESRDIGWYDTCLNGCKYCYANSNPNKAFENYSLHDVDSPLLLGHLKDTDTVQQGDQRSFLKRRPNLVRLDDFQRSHSPRCSHSVSTGHSPQQGDLGRQQVLPSMMNPMSRSSHLSWGIFSAMAA